MATAIGITSGVITLAIFTLNTSSSLYHTVKGFRSSKREMRHLEEELEDLQDVSKLLQETSLRKEAQFLTLSLPLLRCSNACRQFEEIIGNCTGRSNKVMESFQDWAKLQYMDVDIVGFSNMLGSYKSTISIAIVAANLSVHKSSYYIPTQPMNAMRAHDYGKC
jgi:hypothetical protein